MKSSKEQSSGVLGLVMSVLLHAIFFAGCFALDASSAVKSSTADVQPVDESHAVADQSHVKPNS